MKIVTEQSFSITHQVEIQTRNLPLSLPWWGWVTSYSAQPTGKQTTELLSPIKFILSSNLEIRGQVL